MSTSANPAKTNPAKTVPDQTVHRITPARPGVRCWCGADATVTRTLPGVQTHYCRRHWALWWEHAFTEAAAPIAVVTA